MKKSCFFSALIVLLVMGVTFNACKDDGNDSKNKKIDPSTIATDNLIAYWAFEDSPKDEIGNRGVATSEVTYRPGRRGKAYQGAENAYISFDLPTTDKLATMKEFTVAMWVKAQPIPDGKGIPCFFQLSGNGWEGSISVFQENLGDNKTDSLRFKGFFGKEGVPWVGHWWDKSHPTMAVDKWFHFVLNYNSATSIATIYINGSAFKFETLGAYETPIRYADDPGSSDNKNEAPKLGELKLPLKEKSNNGIIGYWANRAFGYGEQHDWNGFYYGLLDELRVYNKALSSTEVQNLYDAEISQIAE